MTRDIVYSVQCIVHSVQSIEYSVQCIVHSVQSIEYSVQCIVYRVQCIVYIVHCIVYSFQFIYSLPWLFFQIKQRNEMQPAQLAVFVDSGETSVCAPYWILAEERLRKREVSKGRGAGGDPPLPLPSSRLQEEGQLCRSNQKWRNYSCHYYLQCHGLRIKKNSFTYSLNARDVSNERTH